MRLTLASSCPLKSGKLPHKAGGQWHCEQCNESVHDISGMTAEDAARFLRMQDDGAAVCGEWASDADGNVLFNLGRAAAAAAALFVAGPAMADGLDLLPQTALVELFGEQGAANVRNDLGEPTDTLTEGTLTPPPPIQHFRGRVGPPTPPPPAPAPTPNGTP